MKLGQELDADAVDEAARRRGLRSGKDELAPPGADVDELGRSRVRREQGLEYVEEVGGGHFAVRQAFGAVGVVAVWAVGMPVWAPASGPVVAVPTTGAPVVPAST